MGQGTQKQSLVRNRREKRNTMSSTKSLVLHCRKYVLNVLVVECLRVFHQCFLSFSNVSFQMCFFNGFLNAHPFPTGAKNVAHPRGQPRGG